MKTDPQPVLYQFSVSHYCEKVRWALDYKQVPFISKSLMPGRHASIARKLSGKSQVPILQLGGNNISGSSAILDAIDTQYPLFSLMPEDPQQQQEVRDWERFADEQIGDHVRRICYYTLLDHKDVLIPLLSDQGPWYGQLVLSAIYPQLRSSMRKLLRVYEMEVRESEAAIDQALLRIQQHFGDDQAPCPNVGAEQHRFLVGTSFTRADLAVSALLAPLCQAPGYAVKWPARAIEPLASTQARLADSLGFVLRNYTKFRHPEC